MKMKTYRATIIEVLSGDVMEIIEQERMGLDARRFKWLCERLMDCAQGAKYCHAMMHLECGDKLICSVSYSEHNEVYPEERLIGEMTIIRPAFTAEPERIPYRRMVMAE